MRWQFLWMVGLFVAGQLADGIAEPPRAPMILWGEVHADGLTKGARVTFRLGDAKHLEAGIVRGYTGRWRYRLVISYEPGIMEQWIVPEKVGDTRWGRPDERRKWKAGRIVRWDLNLKEPAVAAVPLLSKGEAELSDGHWRIQTRIETPAKPGNVAGCRLRYFIVLKDPVRGYDTSGKVEDAEENNHVRFLGETMVRPDAAGQYPVARFEATMDQASVRYVVIRAVFVDADGQEGAETSLIVVVKHTGEEEL